MPNALTLNGYQKFLTALRKEIEDGLVRTERLLEEQKILTYHSMGSRINNYLSSDLKRGETTAFYEKLSKDLEINIRTLQQCEQFFRFFPKLKIKKGLSWSHYRCLLVVADEKERLKWLNKIVSENISSRDLRIQISPIHQIADETVTDFKFTRGILYTYKIIKADIIDSLDTPWFVDCGFSSRIEAPSSEAVLNNNRLFKSVKKEDDYSLRVTDSTIDCLYTFKAKILRILDGDTFLCAIDQGFGLWAEQRLRLRGIDAPELNTLEGEKAKAWVKKELDGLSFVIAKTYKSDKYDRYLTDIFYLPKEKDGQAVADKGACLNEQLLNLGMAKKWR